MGAVYLAEDRELRRPVALKIPKWTQEQEPQLLERFYREARAAATLQHPNICPVYDIGEYEGTRYISMAYISGPALSQLVGSPKLQSERTIAKLVRKIALGLAAAHGKGLLHRDLKPSNIMLDERNEPIIMDFGLARRVEPGAEDRLTQDGAMVGTPAYMSPEQIGGAAERIGPASDVYSLGVILYELLTGQLPYQGPLVAVIGQIVQGQARRPSQVRSGLDERLEAICVKMMAKSVEERYSSAAEVAAALGQYLEQTGQESQVLAPQPAGGPGKLEEHKRQTVELLKQGQFHEAARRLEKLAGVQGAEAEPYVQWARAEQARLKAMPKEVRDKGPTLVAEAVKLLAQQGYAGVVALLESVPEGYRSAEARQLLKQAQELTEEVERLNQRMQQAVRDRQYSGLREEVLDRLLELEPGNLEARDLYEHLGTYGPGEKLRFDKAGMLLPAHTQYWWLDRLAQLVYQRMTRRPVSGGKAGARRRGEPKAAAGAGSGVPLVPIAVGLGVVGVVGLLLGIVFFLRAGGQTVRVELDPALAKDATVRVWLDGKEMEIAGLGEAIKLQPGVHGYEIRRGDEVIAARQFTVLKGDNPALRINVEEDAAAAKTAAAAKPSQTSPATQGKRGPLPLAIAPFNAATAKRHQQAWAEYLGVPVEMTNSIGMKSVLIPPGEFDMGSTEADVAQLLEEARAKKLPVWEIRLLPSEAPKHRVRITRPFYLGMCEVTQAEYERVIGGNPSQFKGDAARPVETVRWDEASAFCRKLGELPQEQAARAAYRLPTEAEWEYGCRSGTTTTWYGTVDEAALKEQAWFDANGGGTTHPVRQKTPNAWGLYDMHGNVWEWCADWHDKDYYAGSPSDDPKGPSSGSLRVYRGGSWGDGPGYCRSAYRSWASSLESRHYALGFRVVRTIDFPPATVAKPAASAAKLPDGPSGSPIRWLGYVLYGSPEVLGQISSYTNIVLVSDRLNRAEDLISAAKSAGLKVIFSFLSEKEPRRAIEDRLRPVLGKHRDILAGVCWEEPYWDSNYPPSEVAAFGQWLKREFPGCQYWCSNVERPRGKPETLPVPDEVDVLIVNLYFSTTADKVRRKTDENLPDWLSKAHGRPVLLRWLDWEDSPPGSVPHCESGTMRACLEAAKRHGLAGLIFDHYGSEYPHKGGYVGIDSNSVLVQEIQDFARELGFISVASQAGAAFNAAEPGFVSLFDGKTLTGWQGDSDRWRVANGAIVGEAPTGVHTFLSLQKPYRDFILKAKFKLESGNSGIQVRSRQLAEYKMSGPQVDILTNTEFLGLCYLEGDKGTFVAKPDPQQAARAYRPDDWNEYVITCQGSRITVELNGQQTLDFVDRNGQIARTGMIGFQLISFGEAATAISFKDIRIRELKPAE
jgi:formylglycine-generating enzyme required for sulfatase activity